MTSGTYTRSGSTVTVTAPDHNLVTGDQVWCDFITGGALDTTYTVTVTSSSQFTMTTVASGTIATSQLNFIRTEGAIYSQSGFTITVTKSNHGLAIGSVIGLAFVAGLNADKTYVVDSAPTSSTFTVTSDQSQTISAIGVQMFQDAQFASYVFGTTARIPSFEHTRLAQAAAYVFGTTARTPELTLFQGLQFAAYTFGTTAKASELTLITQVQSAAYVFGTSAHGALGKLVEMPTASYTFGTSALLADLSCDPQDLDLAPSRATISLIMHATMLVSRGQETVTSALDHMAKQCGFQFASQCPEDLRQTLVTTLNSALQLIYGRAAQLGYFSKKTVTLTLTANTDSITLDDTVQSLEGYIRKHGETQSIPTTQHRSEIDRWADLYPQDTTPLQACFPLREARAHAEGFTHTLLFAPKPTTDTEIDIDVLTKAPRYDWPDYLDRTALRIPHTYAQSILFPVMVKGISSALAFVNHDNLQQIDADWQQARTLLGAVDLAPASSAPDTARQAKATA